MKQLLYIVVDLAKQKVVYTNHNLENVKAYENDHQEKALYLIKLDIDSVYPCCRGLSGVAL